MAITEDIKHFKELAEQMQDLTERAVKEYSVVVEDILCSDSRDVSFIENTLDELLGFCYDPSAVLLYRKLCRHYYEIDAMAAVHYVSAYREMWDSEGE